ncbi:MAG: transcription antitermination factor NusB [Gammaproteobacteria bacterium]|nr:transcription antitermination factor NusB [Gammaproteobacteria bacterium]MCP5298694.1 transcription antitermination factor NusB [Chromatiaceae bacterium]
MSRQRSRSRSLAIQALYQWQIAGQDVGAIINHFMVEQDARKFDSDYFAELVRAVPTRLDELDAALAPCVDRALESVDPVERAILRMGAYELIEHPEIPYRVVINEAVELAKTFGAEQGHRYVNGVLDKAARALRPLETSARR